jgi:hypothetical protein
MDVMGCDTVYSRRNVPTFWMTILPSSALKMETLWFSETLVCSCESTQYDYPENINSKVDFGRAVSQAVTRWSVNLEARFAPRTVGLLMAVVQRRTSHPIDMIINNKADFVSFVCS